MRLIIVGLLALTAGCTSINSASRVAVLQHPETKQTVECKVGVTYGSFSFKDQVENCIKGHEKAGYKLVSDSANFNK